MDTVPRVPNNSHRESQDEILGPIVARDQPLTEPKTSVLQNSDLWWTSKASLWGNKSGKSYNEQNDNNRRRMKVTLCGENKGTPFAASILDEELPVHFLPAYFNTLGIRTHGTTCATLKIWPDYINFKKSSSWVWRQVERVPTREHMSLKTFRLEKMMNLHAAKRLESSSLLDPTF